MNDRGSGGFTHVDEYGFAVGDEFGGFGGRNFRNVSGEGQGRSNKERRNQRAEFHGE